MQNCLDVEIGIVNAQIEQMEQNIIKTTRPTTDFNPRGGIMVFVLPCEEGEQLEDRVSCCWGACGATRCPAWLRWRGWNQEGAIKVQLASVRSKVVVLRRKQKLQDDEKYSRVHIHSAKSHAESLLDWNLRKTLKEIPSGKDFVVMVTYCETGWGSSAPRLGSQKMNWSSGTSCSGLSHPSTLEY